MVNLGKRFDLSVTNWLQKQPPQGRIQDLEKGVTSERTRGKCKPRPLLVKPLPFWVKEQVNRMFFDRVSFSGEPNQSVLGLEREKDSME